MVVGSGVFYWQSAVNMCSVDLDEDAQAGGTCFSCCFVGERHGFEFDARNDWKPMEQSELRGHMRYFGLGENQTCHHVLDHLQRFQHACGEACQ